MTTRQNKVHTPLGQAAVRLFAANDRINQIIIEHLDPIAWKAKPPGKTRTIAAIFTHMHNVRAKWVRLTAPHLKVLDKFRRDGWASPWQVGPEMLCYMLSHEAHHRGQVCMLAHQMGFPLPNKVAYGIWNWEKLWKERGALAAPATNLKE